MGTTSMAVARFIERHRRFIAEQGFSLEISDDAAKSKAFSSSFDEKRGLLAPKGFRSSKKMPPGNRLWVFARDKRKRPAYLQVLAFDDTGEICLGDWFQQQRGWLVKHSYGNAHCPPLFRLSGRIVCQGRLCKTKHRGGKPVDMAVIRLARAIAYLHWHRPDYFYTFLSPKAVRSGTAMRQGYCNAAPAQIRQSNSNRDKTRETWLAYMSRADQEWYFNQAPKTYF